MGCGSSSLKLNEPPVHLELDADATCIMCLECVSDEPHVEVTLGEDGTDTNKDDLTVIDLDGKSLAEIELDGTEDGESGDGTSSDGTEPKKVLVRQDKEGGPWIKPDCDHACHLGCLRARCEASKPKPTERLTFGHLGCCVCRADFTITDPKQQRGAKTVERLLKADFATRATCMAIMRKHAREDPVDRIDGLDQMSEEEADALISRKIGAYRCTKCHDIFAEGIQCGEVADHDGPAQTKKLCQPCTVKASRPDYSKCPTPLYKCDLCCSVAVYRCADYYQCETHHGQGAKTLVKCPGGSKCPLGVDHPQNAHVRRGFVIGCDCGKC